ncbi:hypothetical protein [Ramlibacter sp. Leaf400]|uniref:hypothetical protein n=1 Tax=Ramlibacter sp. Leaf400 TaxID=1736365 RepID=UPI0006F4BA90|nr:hypothetical protein [Ramlibacter sp. Leaf400]KQT10994.1 hypothetical protein ASG30_09355 [Ramlibacter sp. Leaf400]
MEVLLSSAQIEQLTGYKRPGDQLRELKARGFYRARRARVTGEVILERPHYDAVCAGAGSAANEENRPRVRPPPMRRVK